jgi:8-oxo-dGTP diphosphatase
MPQATVAAIVTSEDSDIVEVLLTRRRIEPFKDQWCLPGGHIDQYEPAKEAIVREVKEETGMDFEARFFRYFDEIIPERNIYAVVLVFEGHARGEIRIQEDEVTDIRWFPLEETRSLDLAFTHNEILNTYAARLNRGNGSIYV